jgi:flagellar biosynthesis protein FlhF
MKVRLFQGHDVISAMSAVRRSLGDDALIVETRYVSDGVEILASIERGGDDLDPLVLPDLSLGQNDQHKARLRWHGIGDELVSRLSDGDLAQACARNIAFGRLCLEPNAPPLLFAGEPGAGKSLSVIKVATRLVMAGATPLVISADGRKAGATEQLASMTRLLGLTLIVADEPVTLKRAMKRRSNGVPVLVDGPGMIAGDRQDERSLRAMVDAITAELILVVPGGLDPAETIDIASHHASLGARRMIATRLDVARRIGGLVEAAWHSRLILTEAGIGPSVVDGLEPLTAHFLAERLQQQRERPRASRDVLHGSI